MKSIAEQLAEQAQLAQEKLGQLTNNNIQKLPKSVSEEILVELSSVSDKSLTDDSFPYPEAKAYFIFLTYLYGTMAEKHKLFR